MPEYTFSAMIHNTMLLAPACAWCAAQLLKLLIYMGVNHTFSVERIFGAGGMPSSHSATVCALCTAAGCQYGLNSAAFAITFFFAFIVMYDAMGVRWETGEQAKMLNEMRRQFTNLGKVFTNQKELKEFVGHTPLQVVCGMALGIVIALWVCEFIL